ncbi:MAG: SIMPL domain-containing protein [archaeon]|nr:SIMPL domain-containing protein [archaeon]
MERTITVTGFAKVSAPADTVFVSFTLNEVKDTYKEALSELVKRTEKVKDVAEKAGLDRDIAKNVTFNITQNLIKDKSGKNYIQSGYRYESVVRLEFPQEEGRIASILSGITDLKLTPKINFGFRHSDIESLKQRALSEAVKNAMLKARCIVESAGAKLGPLQSVNRRDVDDWKVDSVNYSACAKYSGDVSFDDFDINPEDDYESESVTLTWLIED